MLLDRYNSYNKNHCWQYDIRRKNFREDIKESGLTRKDIKSLRVSDFEFKIVEDKKERVKLKDFIKKHEWLGNICQYTTHWFACYYKDILAGVILFNVPNSFSKVMGEDTKDIERLISRGACISWSPKNLASSFLMWCIKWMVHNTDYRLFVAYSDPTAKEIGTIYQACNFFYMGQKSGSTARYVNPYTGKIVSDRYFRQKTAYRKYCKEIGIEWQANWMHPNGMNWHNMPKETEVKLRAYSKKKQSEADKILIPPKHKYAFVLGVDKKETKKLRRIFKERNKTFPYPNVKDR